MNNIAREDLAREKAQEVLSADELAKMNYDDIVLAGMPIIDKMEDETPDEYFDAIDDNLSDLIYIDATPEGADQCYYIFSEMQAEEFDDNEMITIITDEDEVEEYDDGDTNWANEEASYADERMEARYGGVEENKMIESNEVEDEMKYTYTPKELEGYLRKYIDKYDLTDEDVEKQINYLLNDVTEVKSTVPLEVITLPLDDPFPYFVNGKVLTTLKDGRQFLSEEEELSLTAALECVVGIEVKSEEFDDNKVDEKLLGPSDKIIAKSKEKGLYSENK